MAYTPNFNDPRTIKKCISALEFVESWLPNAHVIRQLSQSIILPAFGQSNHNLGKYLRTQLLTVTDNHYNYLAKKCKKYRLNTLGYTQLNAQLGRTSSVTPQVEQQLITGEFDYTHKSDRYWTSMQFKPRRVKRDILNKYGYTHEYDLCAAAHSLVLQHSRTLGFKKPTPHLDEYIHHTTRVRHQLSVQLGISVDQVKRLLHSIMNGGKCNPHATSFGNSILDIVGHSAGVVRVNNNHTIQQFKAEMSAMWQCVSNNHRRRGLLLSGQRMGGSHRSRLYRQLESQVQRSIRKYLKSHNNRCLFSHDGWSCQEAVDISELIHRVAIDTGFDIQLMWTIYNDD